MHLARISNVDSVTTTAGRSNCAGFCCRTENSWQCRFTGLHTIRSGGQPNNVEAGIQTLKVSKVRIPEEISSEGNSLRYWTSASSGQEEEEENTRKITIKKLLGMMMMMMWWRIYLLLWALLKKIKRSFLICPLLVTHCRCKGLLLHLITLNGTDTHRHSVWLPLDEGSALRRCLYLRTHNIHKRQAAMPPPAFEHAVTGSVRLQNYALNRAATGIGLNYFHQTVKN
jgi:hypothetical protein